MKLGNSKVPRGANASSGADANSVSRVHDFEALPSMSVPEKEERQGRPRRRGPGCGLCFLLFLVLAGFGAFAGWNALDEAKREEIRSGLVATLSDTLPKAALELLRELVPMLEATPPVPPINESGDGGVLPERRRTYVGNVVDEAGVGGQDAAPGGNDVPVAGEAGGEEAREETSEDAREVAPEVPREDARVRPLFVDDLATWVVERYSPQRQGGSLAVSVQAVNLRYGTELIGLEGAEKGAQGRASILAHVFTPSMVRGIYEIYADSFLRSIAASAKTKGLDERQLKGLYQALGSRCTLYAGGLEGVAATKELKARLKELETREDAVTTATRAHLDARFDLEQARDAGRSLAPFEARVESAARALQEASSRNRRAEAALVEDIRRNGAGSLNEQTVLYLARWVGRRLENNPEAMESVRAASAVLRDLASRCARASREGAPAPSPQLPQPADGQVPSQTPSSPDAPPSAPEAESGQ